MTLGFLGTGAIASAIVTGLSSYGEPRPAIRLSPRNAAVAARLAQRFDNVSVCASNQEVLDSSQTVVLALRPQVAAEILSGLHFSSSHTAISIIAGFPSRRVADLVGPAGGICRAIPLPSVAKRRSPIGSIRPERCQRAVRSLGQIFEIEREDLLNVFSTATSTMRPISVSRDRIASWVARKGIPEQQAREYMARMFAGMSDAALEAPNSASSIWPRITLPRVG